MIRELNAARKVIADLAETHVDRVYVFPESSLEKNPAKLGIEFRIDAPNAELAQTVYKRMEKVEAVDIFYAFEENNIDPSVVDFQDLGIVDPASTPKSKVGDEGQSAGVTIAIAATLIVLFGGLFAVPRFRKRLFKFTSRSDTPHDNSEEEDGDDDVIEAHLSSRGIEDVVMALAVNDEYSSDSSDDDGADYEYRERRESYNSRGSIDDEESSFEVHSASPSSASESDTDHQVVRGYTTINMLDTGQSSQGLPRAEKKRGSSFADLARSATREVKREREVNKEAPEKEDSITDLSSKLAVLNKQLKMRLSATESPPPPPPPQTMPKHYSSSPHKMVRLQPLRVDVGKQFAHSVSSSSPPPPPPTWTPPPPKPPAPSLLATIAHDMGAMQLSLISWQTTKGLGDFEDPA